MTDEEILEEYMKIPLGNAAQVALHNAAMVILIKDYLNRAKKRRDVQAVIDKQIPPPEVKTISEAMIQNELLKLRQDILDCTLSVYDKQDINKAFDNFKLRLGLK